MTLAPTPSPTANVVLAGYTDTVVIVFALVGLMYLTYGYRLMGPTLHLAGAVAGGGVAFAVAKAAFEHHKDVHTWEIVFSVLGALVLGAAAGQVFQLGLFILGAGFGVAVALVANTSFLYLTAHTWPFYLLLGVLGVVFGLLTVRSERPLVIASTSFCGAYGIALCVGHWAGDFPSPFDVLRTSPASHAEVQHAVPRIWYAYLGGWIAVSLAGCALQAYVTGLTPEMRARRAQLRAQADAHAYRSIP